MDLEDDYSSEFRDVGWLVPALQILARDDRVIYFGSFSKRDVGMRFTLCAIGSWGDVAPFISLGRSLLERGSDVVLAAPPEFADAAARAGLDFRPVAPTCTPVVDAASGTTGAPLRAIPLLLRATRILTEETLADLPSIADGSQMLVATGIAYAAPHVADALGIAYRAVTVCPRWYPSEHHPPATERAPSRPKIINSAAWWATKWITNHTLDGPVNRWRRRQGLPPAAGLYTRMIGLPGQRLLAADEELAPLPADVEGTRRVSAVQAFQADSLPDDVEDFLASGDRPVYIGFGSMRATDAGRLLDVVFESRPPSTFARSFRTSGCRQAAGPCPTAASRLVMWRTADSSHASRRLCITGALVRRPLPREPACRRWWFLT
jgi:UDP:flavonoid glycosyltransferase YjiC (YdhE family)